MHKRMAAVLCCAAVMLAYRTVNLPEKPRNASSTRAAAEETGPPSPAKGELSSMLTPLPTASPQPQASTLPLDAHTKDAPVSAHVAPQRDIRALAEQLVLQRFGEGQFPAFSAIVERESGWRTDAAEQSTGAYGLGQALPPEKMAAYGEDWQENPETQIRWMLDYIAARYGSPSQAWDFWQAHRWY